MAGKTIIILDTNFIIEHISDLHELHDKLSEKNDVYVTQISIDERISQKYLELKSKYEKIETFKKEHSAFATIELREPFEKRFDTEKQRTLNGYYKEFGDHIIQFSPDEDVLKTVMERVYIKIAPFLNKDGASDKGFKDTLMWMSILKYFKELEEDIEGVIFITNDNGFRNNVDMLQAEFVTVTGKTIEIKDNNYYKILLGDEGPTVVKEAEGLRKLTAVDKQVIRNRIEDTVNAVCNTMIYDYWENEKWEMTFTTNERFDVDYIKIIFSSLKEELNDHIFENQISAYSIFALDDRINEIYPISMEALDAVNELYEDIQNKYPEYLEQFFNAVCEIMNRNYVSEHIPEDSEDDELPF